MNPSTILKKVVDFLLIFLLVFLTLQFFQKDDKPVQLDGKVVITTTDSKYSIPASVGLKIENNSSDEITLNTCDDIRISSAGDIITPSESLCEDITISSADKTTINYAQDYAKFSTAGNYQFDISLPGKEVPIVSSFEVKNK